MSCKKLNASLWKEMNLATLPMSWNGSVHTRTDWVLDETSKDKWMPSRAFGRSKEGQRAQKKQVFLQGRRVSTEALLTIDGIVSGTAVEGSMTQAMFLDWMEFSVVSAKITSFIISNTHLTEAA